MKNDIRPRASLLSASALLGTLLVAVVVNGCVAGSGQDEERSPVVEESKIEPQIGGNCCEYGYYYCSELKPNGGTIHEFDYYIPTSCGHTALQAEDLCRTDCAVTCTNSGWINDC
jgi:hypothetical protein